MLHPEVIRAWVQEVQENVATSRESATAPPQKRRRLEVGRVNAMPPSGRRSPTKGAAPPLQRGSPAKQRAAPTTACDDGDGGISDELTTSSGGDRTPKPARAAAAKTTTTTGSPVSTASFSRALAEAPVLLPMPKPRSRSRSPTKPRTTDALLDLARPVLFYRPNRTIDALPAEIHPLYKKLHSIVQRRKIFPNFTLELLNEVRGQVEFMDEDGEEFMLGRTDPWGQRHENHDFLLKYELMRVMDIRNASLECGNLVRGEASWNGLVQIPLLRLALEHRPLVGVEPITAAKISPAFKPPLATGGSVGDAASVTGSTKDSRVNTEGDQRGAATLHKMVDFALVLETDRRGNMPGEYERLFDLIHDFTSHPSNSPDKRTINQSSYGPLKLRPTGVTFETKVTSSTIDPLLQLGVWVAAWYERVCHMLAIAGRNDAVIPLPLVTIIEDEWRIYFAVHKLGRKDEIHVPGDGLFIGSTNKIDGIYQIVACIHALADWMEKEFAPWIETLVEDTLAKLPI